MALSLFGGRRSDDLLESMLCDHPLATLPSFSSFMDHPTLAGVPAAASTQVDWKETPHAHIFKANLPGLSKENVKVQVDDGRVLQISGERKKEETSSTDRWHRVERENGGFLRRFRLPENAKVAEVKASLENGVLTVIVPKPDPKSELRDIDISG